MTNPHRHASDHAVLDGQRDRWEQALVERPDRFGVEPSAPAQDAAALFERERLHCRTLAETRQRADGNRRSPS
jgi:hypothetical protein